MNNVLNALYFLFIVVCACITGCVHEDESEQLALKKTNLNRAASYNVQLGLEYLKQGDRPRAQKKLLTALKQRPKSPDVNSALAYYFEQTSEQQEAEKYYLKAISLAKNAGAQLNNYGAFLCRKGDYKKAEYYFLKAVKDMHYVHTAGAYENAGLCALSAHDSKKAKFYFKKTLNQDPSRKMSFYELIKLDLKQGDNISAFALMQKYPDLVLNDRMLLLAAKDISEKIGQHQMAQKYEDEIRRMSSNLIKGGDNNEYNNYA